MYNVFVAFVGLNNNTIVYAQYRIGLVWLIPRSGRKYQYRYRISDRRIPSIYTQARPHTIQQSPLPGSNYHQVVHEAGTQFLFLHLCIRSVSKSWQL